MPYPWKSGDVLTAADLNAEFGAAMAPGGNVSASLTTATGALTPRTLAARAADMVNVQDFGAVGDGITDDTAAIQAAINVAQARAGGQTVWFPAPNYLTSSAIVIIAGSVRLLGGSTITGTSIVSISTTDDIIRFNAASIGSLSGTVERFALLKSNVSSAGYAINFINGTLFTVDQCRIYGAGKVYRGIAMNKVLGATIKDTNFEGILAEAIVQAGSSTRATSDIFLERVRIDTCQTILANKAACLTAGAIRIDDYCGGLFADGLEVYSSNGYGIYFNTTISHTAAGGQNGGFYGRNLNFEGTLPASNPLASGGISVKNWGGLWVGGCSWINGKNLDTITIASTADSVFISDSTIGVSQSDGSTPRGVYANAAIVHLKDSLIVGYSGGVGDAVTIDTQGNQIDIANTLIQQMGNGIRANAPGTNSYTISNVRFMSTAGADLIGLGATTGYVRGISYSNGTTDLGISLAAPGPIGATTPSPATFTNTLTQQYASLGTNSNVGTSLFMNGAAGSARVLQYQTAGVNRWQIYTDGSAESGGNAGSNYIIVAQNDAGSYISAPLQIARATGVVSLPNGVAAGTFGANSATPSGKITITGSRGSATATVLESLLQAMQTFGLVTDSTTA